MKPSEVVAALRKRREKWVDLGDGKRVKFMRPREGELSAFLKPGPDGKSIWVIEVEHAKKLVTGWEGITEADLLGASIAPADPIDFDADLWDEVCSDDIDWIHKVGDAILKSIVDHLAQQEAAAKNSPPG